MQTKKLALSVAKKLRGAALTGAAAESCTGGLLSHYLTQEPGSSDHFKGGIVAYDDRVKMGLLGVRAALLKKHGAVSEAVARAMANGVRRLIRTDFGVGVTGIAGPAGGSKKKPVGLVYIAVASKRSTTCKKFLFKGTRPKIKSQAVQQALRLLFRRISAG